MLTIRFDIAALMAGLLFCLVPMQMTAQTIKLTINVPSGVELRDAGAPPTVIEPPAYGNQLDATGIKKEGVRWIEIRSSENIEFLFSVKFVSSRGMGLPIVYYLNDGSTNFTEAVKLPMFATSLRMYNKPIVMDQFIEKPLYLSSWIGLPSGRGGVMTLEYL